MVGGNLDIFRDNETLEEWVERVGTEPVWREFVGQLGQLGPRTQLDKYGKALAKELAKAVVKDVAELQWQRPPTEFTLDRWKEIISPSIKFVLSSRQEITEKMPEKEKIWRALRRMYEEAKHQKEMVIWLQKRVADLENELKAKGE